jgi:hypothetical protein
MACAPNHLTNRQRGGPVCEEAGSWRMLTEVNRPIAATPNQCAESQAQERRRHQARVAARPPRPRQLRALSQGRAS